MTWLDFSAICFVLASFFANALFALYILQPHVRRDFARWLTPPKRRDNRVINLGPLRAFGAVERRQPGELGKRPMGRRP